MFSNDKKLKIAFKKVKKDFAVLKHSLNGWVLFLNGNQRELKVRVNELERRLARLEVKSDNSVDVLRTV